MELAVFPPALHKLLNQQEFASCWDCCYEGIVAPRVTAESELESGDEIKEVSLPFSVYGKGRKPCFYVY